MSGDTSIPIGKYGNARIIEIYAAVGTTNLNDPNFGASIDFSYYLKSADAYLGAMGIGPMRSSGRVEKRLAIKFDDGSIFLLATYGSAIPAKGTPIIKLESFEEMGEWD